MNTATLTEVRRRRPRSNPDCTAPYHGTASAYVVVDCRCAEAREERRIVDKRRRHGRPGAHTTEPAVGTARRIQALAVLGWTFAGIGARFPEPVGDRAVQKLARGHGRVHVATANRIRLIFRELACEPGPSPITRRRALARGWVPPLAWDDIDDPIAVPNLGGDSDALVDETAIERALDGDPVRLTRVEQHHAIHLAVARGVAASAAGRVLGLSGSTARHYASTPLPEEVAA